MRAQFVASLLFAASAYAAFTIDSPAIRQCQDVTFNIGGATGEVRLTVLPSDKPCEHDGLVIQEGFGNGVATLRNVNVAAGTSIVVVADDDAGNEVWTNTIVITGSAADCAASTSHSASSAARAASTPTTTSRASASNPAINAGSSLDPPASGAASLKASFGFGALVALAGVFFTA